MRRNLIPSYGLLIAISLACQPARAGDRKSAARLQEPKEQILVTQKDQTTSARYELTRPLLITSLEGKNSVSADRRPGYLIEKSDSDTRSHEHKQLTLFHMNSKVGEITVQPLIGHVTGAQCSIGF